MATVLRAVSLVTESRNFVLARVPSKSGVEGIFREGNHEGTRLVRLIELGLANSGYPLKNVHCIYDNERVILTGTVNCYFHLQAALQVARRLAPGRQIQFKIDVLPDLN